MDIFYFIYENLEYIFLLFIFPILGLYLNQILDKNLRTYILSSLLLIISPFLFGYKSTFELLYPVTTILIISIIYSVRLNKVKKDKKAKKAIILTLTLFVSLGIPTLFFSFLGSIKVVEKWRIKKYRIELLKDQGFSGGAILTYKLNRISIIPLYMKTIESTDSKHIENNCIVPFEEKSIYFNMCTNQIMREKNK